MSSRDYHLLELSIARSLEDSRRVMPLIPEGCQRILDVGCGAGQTLIGCNLASGTMACGVDGDFDALQLGRRLTQDIHFLCAKGEQLPFAGSQFDLVISRLALPYMDIPQALAEVGRVLRPGGRLWVVLHSFSMARRQLIGSLRKLNLRDVLFRLYVLANGLAFHLVQEGFRFPVKRRCESFQTSRGIKRALCHSGFEDIEIQREKFFVVTATKRS